MFVDEAKLNDLRDRIENKSDMLFKQIAEAQGNGDESSYNYLKLLEIQCAAQLRLIREIENGLQDNDKYFIC